MKIHLHFKDGEKRTFPCNDLCFLDPMGTCIALTNEADEPFFLTPIANINYVEYEYDYEESITEEEKTRH